MVWFWRNCSSPPLCTGQRLQELYSQYLLNGLHQLAAKLKLNAPYAHTWLEIVHARWGRTAHFIFMFFGSVMITLLSLDCYHQHVWFQASHKYHRFFNAHPRWFGNGKQFNRHAYHCRVLPYPSWCCHLRRCGWHASNAALRLVSPPWIGMTWANMLV